MKHHHPHDGCHGQDRPLSRQDHDEIADAMGDMMLHVARRDFPGVMRAGAHIGVHFGPGGEWALALRLATQVVGLAPLEDCDDEGVPVLAKALSLQDDRVRLMTAHCLHLFPEGKEHTLAELDEAIALAAPVVSEFVGHYKHDRKDDARAAWERMYEITALDNKPNREHALRGAACSALLTCWASHYSAIRIPG